MGEVCSTEKYKNDDFHEKEQTGTYTDSSATYRYKYIQISSYTGDIVDEDVGAIVTIQDPEVTFMDQTTAHLKKIGGRDIQHEVDQWKIEKGIPKIGNILYTHGGDLNCEYIFHAIFSYDIKVLKQSQQNMIHCAVLNCLEQANNFHLDKIAFPLMQNDIMNISTLQISNIMCKAIKQYIDSMEKKRQYIKHIFILLENDNIQQKFAKSMCDILADGKMQFSNKRTELFKSGYTEEFYNNSDIINISKQHIGKNYIIQKNDDMDLCTQKLSKKSF